MPFIHRDSRNLRQTRVSHRDLLENFVSSQVSFGRVEEVLGQNAIRVRMLGTDNTGSKPVTVQLLSPYMTAKSADHTGYDPANFEDGRTASGMAIPVPQIGTVGLIAKADDRPEGFWLGSYVEPGMGSTIPDFATSSRVAADTGTLNEFASPVGLPVGEINPGTTDGSVPESSVRRAVHPFAQVLRRQGLLIDTVRGQTSSSMTRDASNTVLGFNTPGGVAPREDLVGSSGNDVRVPQRITRLGGHTFTMDDGDASGNNNLVRIRSSKGAQILFHDTAELVYIGNQNGSAWIEMTADGKIDIYAGDSVSIHSKGDFNFRADRDFNFEAGRNVNIKSVDRMQLEAEDFNALARRQGKIEIRGDLDFQASDLRMQAADMSLSTNNLNIANKINTRIRSGEFDMVSQFGMRYSAGTGVEFKTNVLENQIWNKDTYNPTKVYQKGNTVVLGTQFFKALKTTKIPQTVPPTPVPPAPGEYWELLPPVIPETVHGNFKIDTNVAGPLPGEFQVFSNSDVKLTSATGKVEMLAVQDINITSTAVVYIDGTNVRLNDPGPGAASAEPIALSALATVIPIPFDTLAESAQSVTPLSVHSNTVTDVTLEWQAGYYQSDTPVYSIMKRIPMHEPWAGHEGSDKSATSMIYTDREPQG